MTATQTPPPVKQTVLADRFIISEIDVAKSLLRERRQLVFPAIWVAEIVRIERSRMLELPFYDPLMAGIIHHRGRVVPVVNAARMLTAEHNLARDWAIVVILDRLAGEIANIGIMVDRAIGSAHRDELPAALFDPALMQIDNIQMMHSDLIPTEIWQPR